MTSSNEAFTEPTKNLLHVIAPRWSILEFFRFKINLYAFESNIRISSKFQKKLSEGQKMTIRPNCFTYHRSKVKKRKLKILLSIGPIHNCQRRYFIFILYIISVITWQNDRENLPIDSLNFFCEFKSYVTCSTSN